MTSRVPGVARNCASTRAASDFRLSRLSPETRMAIGASICGPFSNAMTVMRAAPNWANRSRSRSSKASLSPGSQNLSDT